MTNLEELSKLSDSELIQRIDSLAAIERMTTVQLVWSLASLHQRGILAGLGYRNLFAYCHEHMRMPESTASRYSRSAAVLVRYPSAGEYLNDGRLNPTSLRMLDDALTDENHRRVFDEASGLSQEKIKLLLASLNPKPDVRETSTFVPDRAPAQSQPLFAAPSLFSAPKAPARVDVEAKISIAPPGSTLLGLGIQTPEPTSSRFKPSAELKPTRPGHFSLKCNVDQETFDALQRVRSALSNKMPGVTLAQALVECIRRTDQQLAARKYGALKSKRPSPANETGVDGPHAKRSVPQSAPAVAPSTPAAAAPARGSATSTSIVEVTGNGSGSGAKSYESAATSIVEVTGNGSGSGAKSYQSAATSIVEVTRNGSTCGAKSHESTATSIVEVTRSRSSSCVKLYEATAS
ncbi:MAG: hypothetical protein ACJ790_15735, partial [Myxococcaceae bacterium]